MASIKKLDNGRWKARYYGADGRQHGRSFDTKTEAERFARAQETRKDNKEWIDPALGQTTVGEWAERWLATTTHLKPKTRIAYRQRVTKHVLPAFGNVPLSRLEPISVREWVTKLSTTLSPSQVRGVYQVLSQICASAVENGRIVRNPCDGIKLPRRVQSEPAIISEQ